MSSEQKVQERTQAWVQQQLGELVMACARLRAENEVLAEQVRVLEAAAAAERRGTVDGAQGADEPPTEGS